MFFVIFGGLKDIQKHVFIKISTLIYTSFWETFNKTFIEFTCRDILLQDQLLSLLGDYQDHSPRQVERNSLRSIMKT